MRVSFFKFALYNLYLSWLEGVGFNSRPRVAGLGSRVQDLGLRLLFLRFWGIRLRS